MAVGKYLHERGRTSESRIAIGKEDLKPDTYSPLRDKYPDGNVSLSVRELLEYTLQWSDNNACDILFAHTGGTAETDRYIRSLGLKEFAISSTEDEMHRDLDKCYDNWSSPLEMARLLEILFTTRERETRMPQVPLSESTMLGWFFYRTGDGIPWSCS